MINGDRYNYTDYLKGPVVDSGGVTEYEVFFHYGYAWKRDGGEIVYENAEVFMVTIR